jgi:DNA invertase Pin-like site-specific DNA recombinase
VGGNGELVADFVEIETGKGANAFERRPMLRAALDSCKKQSATLLIAKLDRLSRNVHFVSGLIETGCDFVAADIPQANKVMIQMHAVMAEFEPDQISSRTKAALAAAKARGVRLGATGLPT